MTVKLAIFAMNKPKQEKEVQRKKILSLLFATFLLTRLINLTLLPIFNDEATYIDWGYRMLNQEGQTFHSVLHAKPPFLMWLFGISQKIFTNPLVAGRLVSILAGLTALTGIYFVAKNIFSEKTAYYATFLYIVNPLFTFYDRQALMETAISAIGIWSFYFFWKSTKSEDVKNFLWLGIMLGIGYFIKSNAFVFFLSIVAISIFLFVKFQEKREELLYGLFTTFGISLLVLSPLLLQESFWGTLDQNQKYIFSPSELFSLPITQWFRNFIGVVQIIFIYINPFILLAVIIAALLIVKRKNIYENMLLVWLGLGIGFATIIGKTIGIRYLISFLPILLILAAYFFASVKNKTLSYLIYLAIIPSVILTVLLILKPLKYFDVLNAITKYSQKTHYVTYWSSGYGFDEVISFLKAETKNQRIVVGVRVDAGIPENAVFTYFNNSKQIFPKYLDSLLFNNLENYECLTSSLPLYFVSRDGNMGGLDKYFEEQKRFYKPEREHFIGVHKLKSPCKGKSIKFF